MLTAFGLCLQDSSRLNEKYCNVLIHKMLCEKILPHPQFVEISNSLIII